MLARETFFFSTYRVTDGQPGEVGLAPTHMGSVQRIDVMPACGWLCTGAATWAPGPSCKLDTQFQGLKGFVTGESLSFVTGPRQWAACWFPLSAQLAEMQVEGSLTVDTDHVVAFTEGLQYTIDKVGGGWLQTWLSGEGFVLKFSGQGKVLLQSHKSRSSRSPSGPATAGARIAMHTRSSANPVSACWR